MKKLRTIKIETLLYAWYFISIAIILGILLNQSFSAPFAYIEIALFTGNSLFILLVVNLIDVRKAKMEDTIDDIKHGQSNISAEQFIGVDKKAVESLISNKKQLDEVKEYLDFLAPPNHLIHNSFRNNSVEERLDRLYVKCKNADQQIEDKQWMINQIQELKHMLIYRSGNSDIYHHLIRHIVQITRSAQAMLFVVEKDDQGEEVLVDRAMSDRNSDQNHVPGQRVIYPGQGMLGQCFKDHDFAINTRIPQEYLAQHGQSDLKNSPNFLTIIPLKLAEQFCGVIEIASEGKLSHRNYQLLEMISMDIADFINKKEGIMPILGNSNIQRTEHLMEEEQKLHEAQLQLDSINLSLASIEFDIEGTIVNVNKPFLMITGYASVDLLGKNFKELFPHDSEDQAKGNLIWKSLKQGNYYSGEFSLLGRSIPAINFLGSFHPIVEENGLCIKYVMFGQRLTAKNEEVKEVVQLTNILQSNLPSAQFDKSGKLVHGNELFQWQFGYDDVELKGLRFEDMLAVNPAHLTFDEIYNQLMEEHIVVQGFDIRCRTGEQKQFKINFFLQENHSDGQYVIKAIYTYDHRPDMVKVSFPNKNS